MDDPNRETPEEKRLARRPWLLNLLMLAFVVVFIVAVTILAPLLKGAGDETPGSTGTIVAFLATAAVFVLGIGGLVVMSRLLGWSMEGQRRSYDRGSGILRRTLPDTVTEADEQAAHAYLGAGRAVSGPNKVAIAIFAAVLAFGVVSSLVFYAIRPSLPGLEWLLALAVWAVPVVTVLLVGWLLVRRGALRIRITPSGLRASLLRALGGLVVLALLALVVVPIIGLIGWLFPLVEANALLQVAAFLAVFALGLALVGLVMLAQLLVPLLWALAPLKRGDYATAVRRARLMEQVHTSPSVFQHLGGLALFLAGRYEEARAELEEGIRSIRREVAAGGGAGVDGVGCVLAAQGRYDEAIRTFEAALAMSPKDPCPCNDLANALLERGGAPERALELTDRGLGLFRASLPHRLLERYVHGHLWANRAWALAQLGRASEAAQALKQALAVADRSFVPELAGVLYCAGRTDLAGGDRVRAAEHLGRACQLDPVGHYGRLAARALAGI
jgi:tetratricopeptide (TPR) repeat protein